MERVLKQTSFKSIIVFLLFFLCSAQSSFATTVIIPSDDDMVIGARAILRGKVVAIESSFDEQNSRIYTYITVKVREVLKGQIAERRIVLKELGGQVGDKASVIYGNPQFKKGEKVLLYLDTWADGSLRTYQMFLGKFNIVEDPITGKEIAVRSSPDENTTVLKHQLHGHSAPGRSTERQKLSAYIRMVRHRLAANWERSVRFEAEAYASIPVLAEPPEYGSIAGKGDITPNFSFLGPFRFFEPDSGQPVSVRLNPNPSSEQGVPQVTLNSADVVAAGNAWTNVSGCALQMSYSGPLNQCYLGTGIPGVHVVSNNCDGRNGATSGCAGILAWGGVSQTGSQTRTINGTTFRQTTQGFVSMNPWAACSFTVCNVQEILTHEIGHAIGLGHSQFSDATMAAFAHFDGRCASIRTDDVNGVSAIYPGSGGGPGPLTIVTSSLGGGTVGTPYTQSLSASGGALPYTWSLVQGQGILPPGLSLSALGVITGTQTTTGTYNFTVRVTDNVAATAQKALGIVVSPAGGGGALNSQFVSQTVPTSLQPGQGFTVNMKSLNTGTQTWSGTEYYFVSQNPPLNQTWGGNGVSLFGFAAAPGEQLDVNFTATAPTTPGTYNFQWQMYQNGGVGFFGQTSTNVVIQVGNPPPPPTQYQGYLDGAGCNIITGWAWNANQPNTTINVDIYDGGNLIATVPANLFREDVLNAGIGNGFYGFSFSVPQSLKNNQPHLMRAFFGGTNTELGNSSRQIICSGAPPVYQGYHDGAGCNTISGWAWDANDPNSPINVELYDGTTLIATIPAILYRGDLQPAGIGNGYHGFSYTLPASLKDGNLHQIRVRFPGTSVDLGNTPRTIGCSGAPPQFQGTHEAANCNVISGWAWDTLDPQSPINVAIYADGQWIATVLAIQFRQDLVTSGIGNGYHAFSFNTPANLKDGQAHSIMVKYSGTSTSLSGSPKSFICSSP